jgi:putative transcriptional regulator
MKIKLKVQEIAKEKGIESGYQLHKIAGLKPPTAYRLFRNEAKQISLETLEKICFALECEPGDLFAVENRSSLKN